MRLPTLRSAGEMVGLVNELGFLPFFRHRIPGFSVEECTPPELWFSAVQDGPWEWKGPTIRQSGGAYGKFFRGKAGFVSADWFPDFANYRRDGYDFDARYDDGLAGFRDRQLMEAVERLGPTTTHLLKREAGYGGKDGLKGFDTVFTRLQMECYLITTGFEYETDRHGRPYGWGVGRYDTPERHFGAAFTGQVYRRRPEESFQRMLDHLTRLLPQADPDALRGLLG